MTKFFGRNPIYLLPEGPVIDPPDPDPDPDPGTALAAEGWCRFYNGGTGVQGGGSSTEVSFSNFDDMWDDIVSSGSTSKRYLYTGPDFEGTQDEYRAGISGAVGNKTIKGLGQRIYNTGLRFDPCTNIILDNFHIDTSPASGVDLLRIRNTQGMIVKNCIIDGGAYLSGSTWIFPSADGGVDITDGSDYITLLNCIIKGHDRCHLVGAAEDVPADVGKLRVNALGCLFLDFRQRGPLIREGRYDSANCMYICVMTRQSGLVYKVFQPGKDSLVNVRSAVIENFSRWVEFPANPGQLWADNVYLTGAGSVSGGSLSGSRLWTYPDLGGEPYDLPVLFTTEEEIRDYCLSSNVGTYMVV